MTSMWWTLHPGLVIPKTICSFLAFLLQCQVSTNGSDRLVTFDDKSWVKLPRTTRPVCRHCLEPTVTCSNIYLRYQSGRAATPESHQGSHEVLAVPGAENSTFATFESLTPQVPCRGWFQRQGGGMKQKDAMDELGIFMYFHISTMGLLYVLR